MEKIATEHSDFGRLLKSEWSMNRKPDMPKAFSSSLPNPTSSYRTLTVVFILFIYWSLFNWCWRLMWFRKWGLNMAYFKVVHLVTSLTLKVLDVNPGVNSSVTSLDATNNLVTTVFKYLCLISKTTCTYLEKTVNVRIPNKFGFWTNGLRCLQTFGNRTRPNSEQ